MYVKLPHKDLNPSLCPPLPTSTYTCGVTIVLRVCGDQEHILKKKRKKKKEKHNTPIIVNFGNIFLHILQFWKQNYRHYN